MEKLYYSIGEAAEIIGESVSLTRYWANYFSKFIKPSRSSKGNRQFTAQDIECLKQVHYLVKEKGLTLDGAARQLAGDKASVSAPVKAIESLKSIREQLLEIKKML
ncbi:MAG: MerR family transcriptional regulator [Bacteroidales bacterium]|nr:MerR family transcriptional regulator [Bacteroidales bacterium]